jgi:hypothetical protein
MNRHAAERVVTFVLMLASRGSAVPAGNKICFLGVTPACRPLADVLPR